jgi:hypothetical protein
MRKTIFCYVSIVLLTISTFSALNSQAFGSNILYNPVVTLIGNGGTIPSGTGVTTTLELFQNSQANQPSPVASLSYSGLVNSNSTVEGALSNNPALADAAAAGQSYSGTGYVFSAGYAGSDPTASVTTVPNRVVGYMTVGANSLSSATLGPSQPQASAYAGSTIRAAVGDDGVTNFWTAGTASSAATAGWRYFNLNTQLYSTVTNTRTTQIRNGQLFGSADSLSTVGIAAIGSGTPTPSSNVNAATNLINIGASNTASPLAFALLTDPNGVATTVSNTSTYGYNVAYIADDGSQTAEAGTGNAGIQKWIWNGTAWTHVYSILSSNTADSGYTGLAVQLDTTNDSAILWATTAGGARLEQFADLLGDTSATNADNSEVTLATAPTNDLFRGVALSPVAVPEPSTFVLSAFGLVSLIGACRRSLKISRQLR